jgi:hypothetical protein
LRDGLIPRLGACLPGIEAGQQTCDERCPFGVRKGGQLKLHTFPNRKTLPEQLRLLPRVIEKLPFDPASFLAA